MYLKEYKKQLKGEFNVLFRTSPKKNPDLIVLPCISMPSGNTQVTSIGLKMRSLESLT